MKTNILTKILAFIFCYLSFVPVNARERSVDDMKSIANSILKDKIPQTRANNPSQISILDEKGHISIVGYPSGGFVVIAKDDSFKSVWGYSDSSYDPNNHAPAFESLMEATNKAMEATLKGESRIFETRSNLFDEPFVEPFLKTKWGQHEPYNQLSPIVGGYQWPTGCVQTAMAQIFKYYEYPEHGIGSHTYTDTNGVGGTLSFDFEAATFDWKKMSNEHNGCNNDIIYPEATLMYACAVANEATFDLYHQTSAFIGEQGFSFFDYHLERIHHDWTNNTSYFFDNTSLRDIIYTEIQGGCPILATIMGSTDALTILPHAVVIDGYDQNGLLHVNMGWDGNDNGYYEITKIWTYLVIADMHVATPNKDIVSYDGISYRLRYRNHTASVVCNDDRFARNIDIPRSFMYNGEEYVVDRIGSNALRNDYDPTLTTAVKVSIPNSIKIIGNAAFPGIYSLEQIEIPEGVKAIDCFAFSNLNHLSELSIPNSVEYIGYEAILNCTSLEKIKFGSGLRYVERSIGWSKKLETIEVDPNNKYFDSRENCNALIKTKDNHLVLGSSRTTIPNSIETIGEEAFSNNQGIKSINLNNVRIIEKEAFKNCKNLTEVIFGKSLQVINKDAFANTGIRRLIIPVDVYSINNYNDNNPFQGCSNLEYIEVDPENYFFDSRENSNAIIDRSNILITGCKNTFIPEDVVEIGHSAFSGAKYMTDIRIPESVKKIGSFAFANCQNLSEIFMCSSTPCVIEDNAFYNDDENINIKQKCILYVPAGSEDLYRKAEQWKDFIDIRPWNPTIKIEELVLNSKEITLHIGKTYKLTVTEKPEEAIYNKVVWTSSDENVVTVSADGEIIAVGIGEAEIIVKTLDKSGVQARCKVSVVPKKVDQLVLKGVSFRLLLGESTSLDYTILPEDALDKSIEWSSSNQNVITVSKEGVITAVGYGVAYIYAKTLDGSNKCDSCRFVVPDKTIYYTTSDGQIITPTQISESREEIVSNEYKDGLGKITFSSTFSHLSAGEFSNFETLTSVIVPEGITSIGYGAFRNCPNLRSVKLPESLEVIYNQVFEGCISLDSIYIPRYVNEIGALSSSCTALESIIVDPLNEYFDSRYGCNAVIDKRTNTLIAGCKTTIIPNGIETIGSVAFSGIKGLNSILLPESIKYIDSGAFIGCTGLESIYCMSQSPIEINKEFPAFYVEQLKNCVVYVPETSVTVYRESYGWRDLNVLPWNPDLIIEDIQIDQKEATLFIGDTFQITLSILPEAAANNLIKWSSSNNQVATVSEDGIVTAIGVGEAEITVKAFDGSGRKATCKVVVQPGNLIYYSTTDNQPISLAEWIDVIETFGSNIISNDYKNGEGCIVFEHDIKEIGYSAFYGCRNLKTITLPSSLKTIRGRAFNSCVSLESIIIPALVQMIESGIFAECDALSTIVVEEGNKTYDSRDDSNAIIETMSDCIIAGCPNTVIPSSVTGIQSMSFCRLSTLRYVVLPADIRFIGYAFAECENLTEIYSYSAIPCDVSDTGTFDSFDLSKCTLYVLPGYVNVYKSATIWKDFGRILEFSSLPSSIDEISVDNNEDCIYNLNGYRVNNEFFGIKIKNGKKVLIKE